tara:strand:- start:4447 stop:5634 length:1188 start_codon:yes stop_codon:yes gene_type:complete
MHQRKNITVVGSGYVGMSLSTLLAQKNDVIVLDIDSKRVEKINNLVSTVDDQEISKYLKNKDIQLSATLDKQKAFKNADFIVIATPTNYDDELNKFDTSAVDSVIEDALSHNSFAFIIIKSTIPIGHTDKLNKKFSTSRIVFSPEFLREGNALFDNLYPSRIIIGGQSKECISFSEILKNSSLKKNIETIFISSSEAEAVKLFSNTYLAMRVAFFNELDTFGLSNNLNTKSIIDGICLDERIGQGYNNPSFGYGGYCLPKDTKQLLSNYNNNNIPQSLIKAVVESNFTRKSFLIEEIKSRNPKVVGFYRLVMKEGSDNFRSSASIDILNRLQDLNIETLIYEPSLKENKFSDSRIVKDIEVFKNSCDLIIANRISSHLSDVHNKVFTRDIFNKDS